MPDRAERLAEAMLYAALTGQGAKPARAWAEEYGLPAWRVHRLAAQLRCPQALAAPRRRLRVASHRSGRRQVLLGKRLLDAARLAGEDHLVALVDPESRAVLILPESALHEALAAS